MCGIAVVVLSWFKSGCFGGMCRKEVTRVRNFWVCCGWDSVAFLWSNWPLLVEASCRIICFTQCTVASLKPVPVLARPWLQILFMKYLGICHVWPHSLLQGHSLLISLLWAKRWGSAGNFTHFLGRFFFVYIQWTLFPLQFFLFLYL